MCPARNLKNIDPMYLTIPGTITTNMNFYAGGFHLVEHPINNVSETRKSDRLASIMRSRQKLFQTELQSINGSTSLGFDTNCQMYSKATRPITEERGDFLTLNPSLA
ncbi:hypothetical protein DICVIV_09839 [Dictyocaulus viviparus]|uniref:Uncharacterized protein n=1 Tax=Dictyocaulus viviparus TaxID=29172 RepID=A0A0D8XHP1_DICVI|nr:hypothetical protein DICVIV_09839 [Dictyocaulus viviparus]